MTEEQMLLKEICANPKEDAPRLALADWYNERGVYERAEFIQRSIAQHYRDRDDPTYKDEQFWLDQWVDRFGLDWAPDSDYIDWNRTNGGVISGTVDKDAGVIYGTYERGFLNYFVCREGLWRQYGYNIEHPLLDKVTLCFAAFPEWLLWVSNDGTASNVTGNLPNRDKTYTTLEGEPLGLELWARNNWPNIKFEFNKNSIPKALKAQSLAEVFNLQP